MGWRWENGKMRNKEAWEREEKKIKMTCTQKTTTELKKTRRQSIQEELKYKMETCKDFAGTLPTLDYQCWLEGDKLLYKFFMKPRVKKTVIMMSSAFGENVKVTAHTQEVVPLSKNTSEVVEIETRSQLVDNFYERLQVFSYGLTSPSESSQAD